MSEKQKGLVVRMAAEVGLSRDEYWDTIYNTVMPLKDVQVTTEMMTAFLVVAADYKLNPLTKEIYAFPAKGGLQCVVSVDGWLKLANVNPQFDGLETEEVREDGNIIAVTCKVWRKDRSRPTVATEYMCECKRNTVPWNQWPIRMLTNKAMIQAIRRAFSFAGILDPDEGERVAADFDDVTPQPIAATKDRIEKMKEVMAEQEDAPVVEDEPENEQPPACHKCGGSVEVAGPFTVTYDGDKEIYTCPLCKPEATKEKKTKKKKAPKEQVDPWMLLEGKVLRDSVRELAKMKLDTFREFDALDKNPDSTDDEFRALGMRLTP